MVLGARIQGARLRCSQGLGPESGALEVCLTVDGTANSSALMFLKSMKFFFWSTQHVSVDGVHLDKISDSVDECEVQDYPIVPRVIQWFKEFSEKKGSLACVGIINIDKITASRIFPGFNSSHALAQPFSQATAYPFNAVLDGPHNKLVVHGRPRYFQAPFTQRVCAVHA